MDLVVVDEGILAEFYLAVVMESVVVACEAVSVPIDV